MVQETSVRQQIREDLASTSENRTFAGGVLGTFCPLTLVLWAAGPGGIQHDPQPEPLVGAQRWRVHSGLVPGTGRRGSLTDPQRS